MKGNCRTEFFFIFAGFMDINAYISSGILEQYCMGLASDAERADVEKNAALYPAIRIELDYIQSSLEDYALTNGLEPDARIKEELSRKIYQQESGGAREYPPLVTEVSAVADFTDWLSNHTFSSPEEEYENLHITGLPSTEKVMNALVWAKKGFDEEEHTDCNEFIVILEGHCDMYMNGKKKHYTAGDIIRIPPHIPHHAVITSGGPMMAIVQRQVIAA